MPTAAPHICGTCGGVHSKGERCPKVAARDAERKAAFDAKRPNASQRGYGSDWRQLRAEHLAAHPWCVMCILAGQMVRATDVDHITPIALAPHRRLDPSNLQSLCHHHHSSAKQSQDRRAHRSN
jgi:5-methylcytosine-specific restriction endonuclease McrA